MAANYNSFQERGVYVGFHTRLVEMARCRVVHHQDRDLEYEALIPNWAGGRDSRSNDLVMPFFDIQNWVDLPERDKTLHERVLSRQSKLSGHLDPILVRDIRLQVDIEKGTGIDVKNAQFELSLSKADEQDAFVDILAMFGRKYSEITGHGELAYLTRRILMKLADEDPEKMGKLVRIIATAVTSSAAIDRELLQARLDELSRFSAPICSLVTEDENRDVGFLSRQFGMLERLFEEINVHSQGQRQEIKEAGDVVGLNIQSFMEYTTTKATVIKKAVLDDSFYLDSDRYAKLLELIADERKRISYALDGWASHASRWFLLEPDDLEAHDKALLFILREMPSAPKELTEEVQDRVNGLNNVMALRGTMVKELHSWMDDSFDVALHNRVRGGRGVMPQPGDDGNVLLSNRVKKAVF